MRRNYSQDQSPDSARSSSALHAVQVALDRRDNGGDAYAADSD